MVGILLCFCFGTLSARAEEETDAEALTMPSAFGELREHIPDEAADRLPEDFFSSDPLRAAQAVGDMATLPRFASAVGRMLGLRLSDACRLGACVVGLLMLCAVMRYVAQSFGASGELIGGLCVRLSLMGVSAGLSVSLMDTVGTFFRQLSSLAVGMVPLTGILYALGGNLTQSTVSQTLLAAFISLLDYACASLSPAVCGVCMALSLFDLSGTGTRLSALGGWIRRTYAAFLGLCMFLLSSVLGTQTLLSSARDSIRMRGLRYAVGQMIPVVGGAVSASLGTLSSGIGLLRSVTGTAGILLLGLLLLPTLVTLLLFRRTLLLCASCASLLDCPQEERLLSDVAGLYGYMAAAVTVCSVFFTLSLALLAAGKSIL